MAYNLISVDLSVFKRVSLLGGLWEGMFKGCQVYRRSSCFTTSSFRKTEEVIPWKVTGNTH